MQYLEFDVKDMKISKSASDKTTPISGSVNYYGMHFNFDEAFAAVPGAKSVEFYKNKRNIRVGLLDGACRIPNEMLADKAAFEIRVISGDIVGTPWISVGVTESGIIQSEIPEEESPENMSYVKTLTGDSMVALLRKGPTGLEYSQNGEDWESGVSGVPDVPKTPDGAAYLRKNGDWVVYEAPETVDGLTGTAEEVQELETDSELSAVIAKVNELIGCLKERGVTA